MKENKSADKIKHFAKKKWDNFTDWFTDKEYPHSRLNKNVFFYDALKLIGLILVFLIIYSNLDKINQIVLIFIKLGSLLQLVLLFFILKKVWHLTINLKYAFRGLNHGTKAIISILIVLLLFMAFLNQDKVVNSITQTYEETNFSRLNPVQVSGNFSFANLRHEKKSEFPKVSIVDVSSNPENYYNKNITIDGVLIEKMTHYGLKDRDGRWIIIGQDYHGAGCLESQRAYDLDSKTYTAKGIYIKAKKCDYQAFDLECYNRLVCSEPIF